jgi:hypothetical protein
MSRASRRDVAVVLGTYLVLGLVAGLLWWLLVDPATFTKVGGGTGGSMGEVQLARRFDADGWFCVLAVLGGFGSGLALTWWRRRDPLLVTVLVVLGAAGAAAVMAVTGHLLGPGDPDAALRDATVGQHVPVRLAVQARAAYLVWPIAALVGALVVLWSPDHGELAPEPDGPSGNGPRSVGRSPDSHPDGHADQARAIEADDPSTARSRSAGRSSRSRPRRPAETKTVSYRLAESSSTVGSRRFWPIGEIPPTT